MTNTFEFTSHGLINALSKHKALMRPSPN